MSTLTNFLINPVSSLKRRRSSLLDAPPPPVSDTKQWEFGSYCWKATVEAGDRTFIGYSSNMDITTRTRIACDRHKDSGTVCGEPQLAMKGGECDEVIFMKKTPDGPLIRINTSFF